MTRIISIANQKGGVGKTTTAINMATALAAIKKRVLLIDLDPQGNATTGIGIYNRNNATSYDLLIHRKNLSEAITRTTIPSLSIVCSSLDLVGAEVELINGTDRSDILKNILRPYNGMFDYVIIDSPPSMGILTLNSLSAADGVIIPLQCEYYALEGLTYLMHTMQRIKASINRRIQIYGIVLTMYDKRNSLSIQVEKDVRKHFGTTVFKTVIPRNIKISEAPSHGKPVILYDVKCIGALAYMKLVKEFIEKEISGVWTKN